MEEPLDSIPPCRCARCQATRTRISGAVLADTHEALARCLRDAEGNKSY